MLDRRRFLLLVLLGIAIRLAIIASSVGTNDAVFMLVWAKLARERGLAGAYVPLWELNHPPLSLLIIHLLDRLSGLLRLSVTDTLRVFQTGADLLTLWSLQRFARRFDLDANLGLYYFLCPAVIFVSAFHCNTDPTMLALLVLAIVLLALGHDASSGVALACSIGIKIPPLLFLPFFVLAARSRARVLTGFAATFIAIFLPIHVLSDGAMTRNVFGYAGFAGKWGVTGLLLALERGTELPIFRRGAELYYGAGGVLIVALVLAILALAWKRLCAGDEGRLALASTVTIAFLGMLTLAPGFGVQYLIWPMPFLWLAAPRSWAITTIAATSAYLFLTYTIWSGGFPWWYADSVKASPMKPLVTYVGFPVWVVIGVTAATALVVTFRPPSQRYTEMTPTSPSTISSGSVND